MKKGEPGGRHQGAAGDPIFVRSELGVGALGHGLGNHGVFQFSPDAGGDASGGQQDDANGCDG